MVKTLVLVVDRDDDFGNKGGVTTPVVGIEGAVAAAIDLGVADPEDSDVNGLLAGVNIYKEMSKEGKDVEIALICGDKKVGHKSDSVLIEELEQVIDAVQPDRAILVGDGAEDEYIYPIISSRVRIDSVRKVYVKQTPGIEGFFYIVSKALSDPGKKRRFLAPIGALLTIIAMIYIIADISAFSITESSSYLFSLTAPLVVLLVGIIILFYAYDTVDVLNEKWSKWGDQIRSNSLSATFTLLAGAILIIGFIVAFYSISDVFGNSFTYLALQFVSNLLWPVVFAIFFYQLGSAVSQLVEFKGFEYTILTNMLMAFGIAFMIQAMLDFVRNFLGFYSYENSLMLIEISFGVVLTLMSSLITIYYKRRDARTVEVVPDEV